MAQPEVENDLSLINRKNAYCFSFFKKKMKNLLNFAQLCVQCNLKISTYFFDFILYQKDALKTRLKFTVMNFIAAACSNIRKRPDS